MYRQGDFLLVPTKEKIKKEWKSIKASKGQFVFDKSKVSSNSHAINSKGNKLYLVDESTMFLILKQDETLTHEEHSHISIPKGNYFVKRQREYTLQEIRNVID